MDSAEDLPTNSIVVGIDLGTTFSSVAVYKNGKSEVIGNSQYGDALTPSVVFYDPNNADVSVGKYAEEWGLMERTNFIYDAKRLMGRKYDDVYVQDLIKNGKCSYNIVRGKGDNAAIEIKQNEKVVHKLPEEVASEILKYLKESASIYLGKSVTEAVISVPAHFSIAQRKATIEAAELAGLKVLKLISEPVAAAIHYSMDKVGTKSTLLLFDIGGGTLDVSVVDIDVDKFNVKGLEGDSFLGGRDFDNNLMTHFFGNISENVTKNDMRHILRAKDACTKIKIMLSGKEQAGVLVDHFGKHRDGSLPLKVTREQFESINEDLFNRMIDIVQQCLTDVGLPKSAIDQVILVGGSSRIPKIHSLLGSYFGKGKLKTDINPDQAIALGAAIQAAILSADSNLELEKYKVTEVTPLSIGIKIFGGVMKVGIPKNTPLPAKTTIVTITTENNQKSLLSYIYEGERQNCQFNTLLGSVSLDNMPAGRAGDIKIKTAFNLDESGILTVETLLKGSVEKNKAVVTLGEYRLSQHKMKSTFEDAKRFKQEDKVYADFMHYLCSSFRFCHNILYDMHKISDSENQIKIKTLCDEFMHDWKNARYEIVTVDKFSNLQLAFRNFKAKVESLIEGVFQVVDYTTLK